MSMVGEWLEKRKTQTRLLKALLASIPRAREGLQLPAIEEFVLSEVVNGVVAHVGGNAGEVVFRERCFQEDFERNARDYLRRELDAHKGKLTPTTDVAMRELCEIDGAGTNWSERPGLTTPVQELFHDKIERPVGYSTFTLPPSRLAVIEREVLPSFNADEMRDLRGIGTAMKPFIDEDLEYISKTYSW